jgi:ABC-type sugar transport system substrate-binding protein
MSMGAQRARKARWAGIAIGAAALTISLGACGGSSSTSTSTGAGGGSSSQGTAQSAGKAPKDMHIAFFTDGLSNAYLQAAVSQAKQVAQKAGVNMDVLSADFDINKQLSQVTSALSANKYDAFVVEAVDGEALCKPIENAVKQGIVVSVYNASICATPVGSQNLPKLHTPGTVGFFGAYRYDVGRLYVQTLAKALGGKGKIAYVSGPAESSIVKQTKQGIADALKSYPNVHLVETVDGNWDPAKGLAATQGLFAAHSDLNGIIFDVDQMAVPAIKWMDANGHGNVKSVSQGGTTQAFDLIKQGKLVGTVANLPKEEAGYALQAAIDTLANKPITIAGFDQQTKIYNVLTDPRFDGKPAVIVKSNVDKLEPEYSG